MQTESSVIANLAEIMQLEHERVGAERAAERASREALERAQLEHAERERRHAQRVERVQARLRARAERRRERKALERAAALLRVRLDAEARLRLQREAQAAAQSVQLPASARIRTARAWQHGAWLVAVVLLGAGALVQLRTGATELAAARASEREAQSLTLTAAQDRARLQAELQALRSATGVAGDRVSTPAQSATVQPTPTLRPAGKTASQQTRARPNAAAAPGTSTASQHSGPLDEDEEVDEDPLGGLFDPEPLPRRRAPRR